MKLSTPLCPECGKPARGTYDNIPGIAIFGDYPSEDGEVHYCDTTDVDWNGQYTVRGRSGKPLVICEEDHLWETDIEGLGEEP